MEMVLYINNSDNRDLNKNITQLSTVEIKLKDDNEVVNPTVILSGEHLPPVANYAYIAALHRYYFINGQRIKPGKQLELMLKVDVLMSWQAVVKSAKVIASRSSNLPNKQIPDQIPLLAKRNVIYKRLEGGIYERGNFGSDKTTPLIPAILLSVINGRGETPGAPVLSLVSKFDTTVSLSWTEITGAEKYQLFMQSPSAVDYSLVTETVSTTHSINVIDGYGKYRFKVRSLNSLAQSSYSNILIVDVVQEA